jgi:cytochrome P450 family 135
MLPLPDKTGDIDMTTATLPDGPSATVLRQSLAWGFRPRPYLDAAQREFGDMFTVRLAQVGPVVMLAHPDMVKDVFTGDPAVFHAGEANVVLRPALGRHSVLLLDDAQHMRQRKVLLPPFHGERMQRYGELMREIAERDIATWPRGVAFRLHRHTQDVTLRIIVQAVFGVTDEVRSRRLHDALKRFMEWGTNPVQALYLGFMGVDRVERNRLFRGARAKVDKVVYDEIRLARERSDLEEREDILSLLLQARHEDGSPMSDEELRDELMTLLVAGHETTATSLAWAIERLVRHPDALARLTAEAAEGGTEYAEAVTKETLRMRPVIPIVARLLKRDAEIGGRLLPEGTIVAPNIYLVQHREDVYPEPRRFRPERFLEGQGGTYSWFPFGGGVRRCIGASFAMYEMRIVLQAIVGSVALRAAQQASEPVGRRSITLTPRHGAEVVAA